ncbi:MAG: ADP-ribosylglycohydrolase family protein [Planctomycetota bacterium]
MNPGKRTAVLGCILGTAAGDALGLPYEGLGPERALRLLGPPTRHRFLFGRGMLSDDTEHTCIVAQSLIEARGDRRVFARRFAWRLRWWILGLPAGVGRATGRACLRLWFGAGPERSGVDSAGNGPAMRAAIFGVVLDDLAELRAWVRVSTRMTHTDPLALQGALVVALAARHARLHQKVEGEAWLGEVERELGTEGGELFGLVQRAVASAPGRRTRAFAARLGLQWGVTGYTPHTIPVAIHAWLAHPGDFRAAVTRAIECGGDADTVAAIAGGIVGAGAGEAGIPLEWLAGIWDGPRSVRWMKTLGTALADACEGDPEVRAPGVNPAWAFARNGLFLLAVLAHGLRRLAPPY